MGRPQALYQGRPISRAALWEACEYEPHEKQMLFHQSEARFKIPASGRRFGKSKMSVADICDLWFVPDSLGWIVAETYGTGEPEFSYAWDMTKMLMRRYSIPEKAIKHEYNTRTGSMYIQFPWGHRIECKSAAHVESLVGRGLLYCIFAEAAKTEEIVFDQYIRGSLTDWRAPCSFPSTPEGDNWFKRMHDKGQDPDFSFKAQGWENSWESWNFPSWENPYMYPLGFDDPEIKSQMGTPEGTPYFWQEVGAKFNVFVGQIYPGFTKSTHVLLPNYRETLELAA